ncbi:MAG: hypothetical protein AB7G75_10330 [Candidatus Binatia bacterium]
MAIETMNQYHRVVVTAIFAIGLLGGVGVSQISNPNTVPSGMRSSQISPLIRAQRFELVNETGQRRALLELAHSNEPALRLYDTAGKPRLELSLRADGGPNLLLWDDRRGIPRAGLALLPDGSPSLEFADQFGDLRSLFGLDTNGEPLLGLFDQQGNLYTAVFAETGNAPVSYFHDTDHPQSKEEPYPTCSLR